LRAAIHWAAQKKEIEICPHGTIVCGIAHNKEDIKHTGFTVEARLAFLVSQQERRRKRAI
jgi:hypothetical protein